MWLSKKKINQEYNFFKKLVILLGFKEAYFFFKNVLGMVIHPHLTTAKILREPDLSQTFLVFGLPFNLGLLFLIFSVLVWFFLKPSGLYFKVGFCFFVLVSLSLFALAVYYLYWAVKYMRKSKEIGTSD
jgi:hypothetical protein